nr:hypothetical protein EC90111_1617 [Escherichia coli 9.0111]
MLKAVENSSFRRIKQRVLIVEQAFYYIAAMILLTNNGLAKSAVSLTLGVFNTTKVSPQAGS